MARAYNVFVVLNLGDPVAGFTVKHELRTWLRRQFYTSKLAVYRMPDNPASGRAPERLNIDELIAED